MTACGSVHDRRQQRPAARLCRSTRRVHDATLFIEQGVHIRVVQEILGHTRVTTTERYTHVATTQMRDASDRMDEALWGPG
ncbi:tyrosine-type recombinase/integrase [Nonomuraea sp. NEAU-A123]|nr:tyrosine-type recombinase/integrase [Nonomuraea sp. NEAU-A123]